MQMFHGSADGAIVVIQRKGAVALYEGLGFEKVGDVIEDYYCQGR